jgi:uncharacterized Ntn-hydrolase superfamily protein
VTYSIVARDPATRELGVAVQTGTFGVGRAVPWARAGVGAIATQSYTERRYGALGLERLARGEAPADALAALVAEDEDAHIRQVGIVDALGRTAAHTGAGCIRDAGHLAGQDVSVQANMMATDRVWSAMAAAFGSTPGTLARRLLAALLAAEAEGGDFRGPQSAALLVVSGERDDAAPWAGVRSDLRVEDHADPLGELARLLEQEEAYHALADAEDGRAALAAPLREKDRIWAAARDAAGHDDPERARELLQPLFDAHPNWRDAVRAAGERGDFPGWQQILA